MEPSFASISFYAGTAGPLTSVIEYSVPPDDTVEPDEAFMVEAEILQPEIALFGVDAGGSEGQPRVLANFSIFNDDGQL